MALGAQRQSIAALLLGQGLTPALAGLVLGTAGALALSRLAAGLLFEISPTDASTYLAALAVLLVAAAAACLGPALRASRVDPLDVLRGG